nr:hypothetical protein [Tanacetum cinerariifolium]
MNYLEEQTDGEAMINSIQNGDHPLPVVAQVSLAENAWLEYSEQDRKAAILYKYETFKATKGEQLLDTYLCYLHYGTLMRKTKNLMDINIDALYNILKQNQGDVNDALGYKKKAVVIIALLAKAFNRKKFYAKPTNTNLRTSSAFSSANKKPEYVKSVKKKEEKKDDKKKRDMSKVNCYNYKKE